MNAKTGLPCSVHDIIAENKPVSSETSRTKIAVLETVFVASTIKADISRSKCVLHVSEVTLELA
jgi:hypothetical protein